MHSKMLKSYEHEISFIDLKERLRICQHLQLITIRLKFMVKRSLNVLIFNRRKNLLSVQSVLNYLYL